MRHAGAARGTHFSSIFPVGRESVYSGGQTGCHQGTRLKLVRQQFSHCCSVNRTRGVGEKIGAGVLCWPSHVEKWYNVDGLYQYRPPLYHFSTSRAEPDSHIHSKPAYSPTSCPQCDTTRDSRGEKTANLSNADFRALVHRAERCRLCCEVRGENLAALFRQSSLDRQQRTDS